MSQNKVNILFVDDEKSILNSLKRMLRSMRDQWDMHFVENASEALKLLEQNQMDIIITDMRMPTMDGATLLHEVSAKYPDVVRMVLSGQSTQESVFKAIGPSHQYFSKPYDPKQLISSIEKACQIRREFKNSQFQKVITQIKVLPSLPKLYDNLLELIKKEDVSTKEVGQIIQKDIGMASKILQLVNSSYFGLARNIDDVVQAVNYLGLDTVKGLILSLHIFEQFEQEELCFSMEELWNHSLLIAMVAKEIAKSVGAQDQVIHQSFVSGILHDCGHLVFAVNFPQKYHQYLNENKDQSSEPMAKEKEIFGTTHDIVGAYLLGLWGFPDPVVEAVAKHRIPQETAETNFSCLTALHIANALDYEAHQFSHPWSSSVLHSQYLESLNLKDTIDKFRQIYKSLSHPESSSDTN